MNEQKVQQIISKEIEEYQKSIRWSRQYAPAKWQIEKLTELGIIDLMPAKFGHGDAGHIIKLAEDKQSAVFNAFGEGEDVPASTLNKALNEAEETTEINVDYSPQSINVGGVSFEIRYEDGNIEIYADASDLDGYEGYEVDHLHIRSIENVKLVGSHARFNITSEDIRIAKKLQTTDEQPETVEIDIHSIQADFAYMRWLNARENFSEKRAREILRQAVNQELEQALAGNGVFVKDATTRIAGDGMRYIVTVEDGVSTDAYMDQIQGNGKGNANDLIGKTVDWLVENGFKPNSCPTMTLEDAYDIVFREYELGTVVTTKEIAESYGISDAAVRQAIADGNLPARKSGNTWLILRKDAEARWNK